MNHVIPHHLFLPYYVSNYGWMCFFVATFIHLFYIGVFERSRFAPISFLFHHHSSIFLLDPPLTSDKMAKSWAFFLTSRLVIVLLFLQTCSFPWHSQPWPKGDPCCTDTLFLSNNLNAGPLALHETGHVYWAEPGSRSHNPPISFGHVFCVQTGLWTKGDPVRGCTVIVFTLWEGWGLRGRERESGVLVTEAVLGRWVYCIM